MLFGYNKQDKCGLLINDIQAHVASIINQNTECIEHFHAADLLSVSVVLCVYQKETVVTLHARTSTANRVKNNSSYVNHLISRIVIIINQYIG